MDLRLDRHLFEFDGRVTYRRPADGGLADRRCEDVVWQEKQRQDRLGGFELGMSRIVWDDPWGAGRPRTLRRLEREYRDTCARFGTDLTGLAPYLVSRRVVRPRDGRA